MHYRSYIGPPVYPIANSLPGKWCYFYSRKIPPRKCKEFMTSNILKYYFALYLSLAVLLPASALSAQEGAGASLPDWQKLEYEQSTFFATARSSLELVEAADGTDNWTLLVNNSVVDNSESIQLEFNPVDGRAISRTRLSSGKDKRYKAFRYGEMEIFRERREPGQADATSPGEWEITSTNRIAYPQYVEQEVVTGSYALIVLANQMIEESIEALDVIVHTDFNFYTVEMTSKPWVPLHVEYEVEGLGKISGKRNTIAVKLKISPMEGSVDGDDFSLLGLQDGYIILAFDKKTGVLLQLHGEAPHIGSTDINLKKVYPRVVQ